MKLRYKLIRYEMPDKSMITVGFRQLGLIPESGRRYYWLDDNIRIYDAANAAALLEIQARIAQ